MSKKNLKNLTLIERLNLLDDGGLNQNDLLYSILFDLVEENEELNRRLREIERKIFPDGV